MRSGGGLLVHPLDPLPVDVSPAYVKEQMGHHSIKVTVDTYGHPIPGANKAAVDRLDVTGRNPRATGKRDSRKTLRLTR